MLGIYILSLFTFVVIFIISLVPDPNPHRVGARIPRPDKAARLEMDKAARWKADKAGTARKRKVIPHPEVAEMWMIEGSRHQSMSKVFLGHLAAKLDEVDPLPELPARRSGGPVTTVVTPAAPTLYTSSCKYCKFPTTADHSSEYIWSAETSGPVCVVCRTRFGMVKAFVSPEEVQRIVR